MRTNLADVVQDVLQAHRFEPLPVVDDNGHLRGIVSLGDVVPHAGAASPTAAVRSLARTCEPHRTPVAGTS